MNPLSVPSATRRMGAAAVGVVLLAALLPQQAQAAPLPGAVNGATDSKSQRRADYDSRQTLVLIDGVPLVRADFGTASWT